MLYARIKSSGEIIMPDGIRTGVEDYVSYGGGRCKLPLDAVDLFDDRDIIKAIEIKNERATRPEFPYLLQRPEYAPFQKAALAALPVVISKSHDLNAKEIADVVGDIADAVMRKCSELLQKQERAIIEAKLARERQEYDLLK